MGLDIKKVIFLNFIHKAGVSTNKKFGFFISAYWSNFLNYRNPHNFPTPNEGSTFVPSSIYGTSSILYIKFGGYKGLKKICNL